MSAKTPHDFELADTDEPHKTRRKLILAKYPEIKNLMKIDPYFKWQVLGLVLLQISTAFLLRNITNWFVLILSGYFISGIISRSLALAIHEIAHGQAFGPNRVSANRFLGMLANLPLIIPFSVTFKKYHFGHHRFQGDERLDIDLPSKLETQNVTSTLEKLVWVVMQPLFYLIRPLFFNFKGLSRHEIINLLVQLIFSFFIAHYCGLRMVFYLFYSAMASHGLHPLHGGFISDHYVMFTPQDVENKLQQSDLIEGVHMFRGKILTPETYSYYGPLNMLTFNVGYHVEHHDFPSIPGSKLPLVRKIAPEFYENLCCHTSWVKVLWQFIFDPSIGPLSRVKRKHFKRTSHRNNISKEEVSSDNVAALPVILPTSTMNLKLSDGILNVPIATD